MRAFAVSDRYLEHRMAVDDASGLADLALGHSPQPLETADRQYAQYAWGCFAKHSDPRSGFAPSSDQETTLSAWEMGATFHAITAANRLGIIPTQHAMERLSRCLDSVARLSLCPNKLPGRIYQADTLKPASIELAWSAREILRLVSGFIVAAHHYPTLAPEISILLNRWNLDILVEKGRLWSGVYIGRKTRAFGDCFLGYEQYAARAACLINLPADAALDPNLVLRNTIAYGNKLPADKRVSSEFAPQTRAEPFILDALEFGWRPEMLEIALMIYQARRARFEATGFLTLPSGIGGHASTVPYLSTKTAFGWAALLQTPYSQKLLDTISDLATDNGWQTGIYEANGRIIRTLSLNTNAVVLEALHYKAFGPLFSGGK
jgi:hypothetical protein